MNPRTSSHQTYTFEPEVPRCWILPHWPPADILEWASQGWLDDTSKSQRAFQSPSFTSTALAIGFAFCPQPEVKKTSLVSMPRKCWNFEGFKDHSTWIPWDSWIYLAFSSCSWWTQNTAICHKQRNRGFTADHKQRWTWSRNDQV